MSDVDSDASHGAVGFTVATNLALAGLAVLTGVMAARLLGPEGEGALAAIQTWPVLLATLAMLGLPEALVFSVARRPELGMRLATTSMVVAFVSSVVVAGVAWMALPWLLSAQKPAVIAAARVFLLFGPAYALVELPHEGLRGAQKFLPWNILRIAPGLAWLAILAGSWLAGHPNAIELSRLQLLGIVLVGLPVLIVTRRTLVGSARPDAHLAPELVRYGLPCAFATVPQTINLRLDQLLIAAFLPAPQLGLYVVAVAWSGGVAPLLSAVASVLFPRVSAEADPARQSILLAGALSAGSAVAVMAAAGFMAAAPFGLPLIFGHQFAKAVPSALVLVPAGAVLGWVGIAEEGMRGLGRPGLVLAGEGLAAAVTLGSLPWLLHAHGVLGAAIASLLGYLAIAVFMAIALSQKSGVRMGSLILPSSPTVKTLVARVIFLMRGHRPKVRSR